MLSTEAIQESASLIQKNAKFIGLLAEAQTVELYDQYWPDNHTHSVGYYTLVGVNGDIENVIPFPVLANLLGSGRDVLEYMCSKPVRMHWKENRTCALGKHTWSQEQVVHGTACEHPEKGEQDYDAVELSSCINGTYCKTCEKSWPTELEAPKVPLTDWITGYSQEFQVDGDPDGMAFLCRSLPRIAA